MLFAIDPGNEFSAYVVWDETQEKLISFGKEKNDIVCQKIRDWKLSCPICLIEMISAYGQVGKSVLDTCVWIGIFSEVFGRDKVEYIFRKTYVTCITGSPKGNDSAIRSVMVSRFGNGDPRKRQKGNMLEGISADSWQALAIAVYKSDCLNKKEWHGDSSFVSPQKDKLI